MPELPEVQNVVQSLINKVKGKKITTCVIFNPKIIKKPSNASNFEIDIIGQEIIHIEREGKYIIFRTTDYYLVCHLAMTGALLYNEPGNPLPSKYANHTQVILHLDNCDLLYYCDIRKFGGLRLLTPTEYHNFDSVQMLGPDPLKNNALSLIKFNLKHKSVQNKTIKEALMDQSVVSGIGNIYACEILFEAKIDPNKLCKTLSDVDIELIYNTMVSILTDSISKGGSSISDYMNADGVMGTYQNYLKVYGKKVCPICKNKLSKIKIAQRSTYYCNSCQK